jgi:hypothetical protein
MVTVDGCLLVFAGLIAVTGVPWWSFVFGLILGAAILTVYGWMAAAELGIRSRDEMPRAWLTALAVPCGVAGVLAAQSGRYGPLVVMACLGFAHAAERFVWMRFDAAKGVAEPG